MAADVAGRELDDAPDGVRLLREVAERLQSHFDVVAAARTASLTAVGVMAMRAFWARLGKSNR
jgi:hypothetical protein